MLVGATSGTATGATAGCATMIEMTEHVRLPPGIKRALEVLLEHGPCTPSRFASFYFVKDHPGWKRHCRCGPHGSHAGSGLVMAAGGLLGKLRKRGLAEAVIDIYEPRKTKISPAGQKALRET